MQGLIIILTVFLSANAWRGLDKHTLGQKYIYGSDRNTCRKDSCLDLDESTPGTHSERWDIDAKTQMAIFNSLTPNERKVFQTIDEINEKIRRHTEKHGTDPNVGMDNILANYPQYRDRVLNDIKPLMMPGTYGTLKLVNGCCMEFQFQVRKQSMMSVSGLKKSLVHFDMLNPPQYQFAYFGLCAEEGAKYCRDGHCHQAPVPSVFLVYDHDSVASFDLFEIPAFCKCHSY